MAYLLFFGYFVLLLWAIPHLPIIRKTGQPVLFLRAYWGAKVVAGVAYGYFHAQRGGGDTWMYHSYGLEELSLLQTNPLGFVTSIINPGYVTGYGAFFGTSQSWWNDLDGNVFAKMLAISHLASGSNYYINSLFFNLFSFAGTLLLLKVWRTHLGTNQPLLAFAPFLVPSFIFWSSGIHKENLLVLSLGLIIYSVYFSLCQQKITILRLSAIVAGLLIVLVMRNYLLLPLGLWLFALVLAKKIERRIHPALTFFILLFFAALLFFNLRHLAPALDLPQVVVHWQEAFHNKRSPNRFHSLPLQPSAGSFLSHAPQAWYNAALRPMIWEANNPLSFLSAIESLFILLIGGASLLLLPQAKWRDPYFLFCLFFSASVLLIIGYTVMFPGAIVRYRSIILPMLLMPSLAFLYKHPHFPWVKKLR